MARLSRGVWTGWSSQRGGGTPCRQAWWKLKVRCWSTDVVLLSCFTEQMTEISYLLLSAWNFFSRNDSFQHRGERPTDHFEWLSTACKEEGGKKTASLLKNVWKGKKRLSPDSGLRVATAYLAQTSVIARNVGRCSCEACGQRDRPAELWGSSILQPKHWRIRGQASAVVRRLFSFSFASWHELNKWASGQFSSPLLSRRLNFWIFAAPMINRF